MDQAIAGQTEQTVDSNSAINNVLMTRPHSLVMRHKSIYTIYYERYGLETYKNRPVEDGIAMLEAKFKMKWR
jgi:hypothetical protein